MGVRYGQSHLPRISRLLADHLNNQLFSIGIDHANSVGHPFVANPGDIEQTFREKNPIVNTVKDATGLDFRQNRLAEPVHPHNAMKMLQYYRKMRIAGYDMSKHQDNIREAYKNRTDYTG